MSMLLPALYRAAVIVLVRTWLTFIVCVCVFAS